MTDMPQPTRAQRVIVTERNVAGQIVREVEIERVFENGRERQTTVRAEQFDTLTSEAFRLRALSPDEARRYVAEVEARGFLAAKGS